MPKTTLDIRPGQRQRVSPYLKKSIAVLKASSKTLQGEIQLALESNPFLERGEQALLPPDPRYDLDNTENEGNISIDRHDRYSHQQRQNVSTSSVSLIDNSNNHLIRDEFLSLDPLDSKSTQDTLDQHIRDGLPLNRFDARERMIAEAIIANLDPRGYLDTSFDDLRSILPIEVPIRDGEFEKILSQIQQADLAGIGARDLRECLILQLNRLDTSTPQRDTAIKLVDNYLSDLAENKTVNLLHALHVSQDALVVAIDLIKSLDPEPGQCYTQDATAYITPDVFLSRQGQQWIIRLNPYLYPTIKLNPSYIGKSQTVDTDTRNFLNKQLLEAQWLIGSIRRRHETILRIANEILRRQEHFFLSGELKPLTRRAIADALNLHPSTISRGTIGKYMFTPKGTFEFTEFFSQKINAYGANYSASMAKSDVRRMIELESPKKPLSDQAISQALQAKGIRIARRTVTKYRKEMLIQPSNFRRNTI